MMLKLFSAEQKAFLKAVDKSEAELSQFLEENWSDFFPQYQFIKREFVLEGNVRSRGSSGRIDILAFNPKTSKFVVFELKKNPDKNIRNQASDYRDFIEDNFSEIYLITLQKYKVTLPTFTDVDKDSIEVVMIAKEFSATDVERVKKSKSRKEDTTLIRYVWFERQLLLIDYINNDPDDLIERENTEKIKRIKQIVSGNPVTQQIDMFFFNKNEGKRLFNILLNELENLGAVAVDVQQTKIRLTFLNQTFSIVAYGGKTGRRSHLMINTDIERVVELNGVEVVDRVRPGQKKKGSVGTERYEIFVQTEDQLRKLISIIDTATRIK